MYLYLLGGGIFILLVACLLWGAIKYGRKKERLVVAEQQTEDMAHDAVIASKPSIDRPLGRMRPK